MESSRDTIRPQGQRRIGARFGCRSTALRLAPLAFAPFRASQTKKSKKNPGHLCFFLSVLLINQEY